MLDVIVLMLKPITASFDEPTLTQYIQARHNSVMGFLYFECCFPDYNGSLFCNIFQISAYAVARMKIFVYTY